MEAAHILWLVTTSLLPLLLLSQLLPRLSLSCLSLSLIRILVITLVPTGQSKLLSLSLITPTTSLLPSKVIYPQGPGIRSWTSRVDTVLPPMLGFDVLPRETEDLMP